MAKVTTRAPYNDRYSYLLWKQLVSKVGTREML